MAQADRINTPTLSRRAALSLSAGLLLSTSSPAARAGASPDPIFALLAEHSAACAAIDQAGAAVHDDDLTKLVNASDEVADRILDVDPTTIAGCAALLRYTYQYETAGKEFCGGYVDTDLGPEPLGCGHSWHTLAMRNVARALDRIASV